MRSVSRSSLTLSGQAIMRKGRSGAQRCTRSRTTVHRGARRPTEKYSGAQVKFCWECGSFFLGCGGAQRLHTARKWLESAGGAQRLHT